MWLVSADTRRGGTRDESQRESAWEATHSKNYDISMRYPGVKEFFSFDLLQDRYQVASGDDKSGTNYSFL